MSKFNADPNLFIAADPANEAFWYCYGTKVSTMVMNHVFIPQFIESGFSVSWMLTSLEAVDFPHNHNAFKEVLGQRKAAAIEAEEQRIEHEKYRRANYPTPTERALDEAEAAKKKAAKQSQIDNRLRGMHKGISGSNAISANWAITP